MAKEGKWTTDAFAKNNHSQHPFAACVEYEEDDLIVGGVYPKGPGACYCALGAIARYSPDWGTYEAAQARLTNALRRPWSNRGVEAWNDARGRTREQVLAAFDKAIEAA